MATPRAAAAPAGFPGAVELAAPGAVERGLTGTDFSSTGFAAQATRTTSAGIQNRNLIASQTFEFQGGRASYGSAARRAHGWTHQVRGRARGRLPDPQAGSSRTRSRHSVRTAGARSPLSVPK